MNIEQFLEEKGYKSVRVPHGFGARVWHKVGLGWDIDVGQETDGYEIHGTRKEPLATVSIGMLAVEDTMRLLPQFERMVWSLAGVCPDGQYTRETE